MNDKLIYAITLFLFAMWYLISSAIQAFDCGNKFTLQVKMVVILLILYTLTFINFFYNF
jgi:hypothetical protein